MTDADAKAQLHRYLQSGREALLWKLDGLSEVPPFEQLRVQVIQFITSGSLVAGTRLPTVRRLATDLGVAPNTVARAYRELEAAEFIETRGRAGSFVKAKPGTAEHEALSAARSYVQRVQELGISPDDAVAFVAAALK